MGKRESCPLKWGFSSPIHPKNWHKAFLLGLQMSRSNPQSFLDPLFEMRLDQNESRSKTTFLQDLESDSESERKNFEIEKEVGFRDRDYRRKRFEIGKGEDFVEN